MDAEAAPEVRGDCQKKRGGKEKKEKKRISSPSSFTHSRCDCNEGSDPEARDCTGFVLYRGGWSGGNSSLLFPTGTDLNAF